MIKIDEFKKLIYKYKYLVGILVLFCGIATLLFINGMQTNTQEVPTESSFHDYDTVIEQKAAMAESQQSISIRSDKLPSVMYKHIESMPDDFYNKRYKFQYPMYFEDMNVCGLESKYYNQPEWFIFFEDKAIPTILGAEIGRHGISPYPQIYPSDQIISMSRGNTANICTLLRTSYLTELYVGMSPKVVYLDKIEIKPDFHGIAAQSYQNMDINEAQEHVTVTVTPNNFYLRPSYPIFGGTIYNNNLNCKLFGCDENLWTQKLHIKVDVDKDIEPGMYAIGIDFVRPDSNLEKEWYYEFDMVYKSVGGAITINMGREPYQLLIQVL